MINKLQKQMKRILLSVAGLLVLLSAGAQGTKNLAQLLGYPRDSKLLIIHADDMGLSGSVNKACQDAFDTKSVTSGSIMMPCPAADEMMAWLKKHPEADAGIHLTMTSEWDNYKWGGVKPASVIPSLLDKNGHFYPTVEELGKTAKGEEAEKELRAQIDMAIAAGIKPSHLDTHMGSVLANPELIKVYIKLAAEYKLPFLLPRQYLSMFPPEMAKMLESDVFLLDNLFMLDPKMIGGKWIDAYRKGVEELKPGLNQIIVHLGIDNEEMRNICRRHMDYGSQWRQKDLDLVKSAEFKKLLADNNVILISWGDVKKAMEASNRK
jgi:chitin disaccharide deacetylase